MLECGRPRNAAPPRTHHGGEFAFEIQLYGDAWAHDRASVTHQTRREAGEDDGIVRLCEAALGRMVGIVQPNADDLLGLPQGREYGDAIKVDQIARSQPGRGADESLMTPGDQALEAAREARVQCGVASILTVAGLDRHPLSRILTKR